jgi:hypothetical protein
LFTDRGCVTIPASNLELFESRRGDQKEMIKNWLAALVLGVFTISFVGCGGEPKEVEITEDPEEDLGDMEAIGGEDAGTPGGTETE